MKDETICYIAALCVLIPLLLFYTASRRHKLPDYSKLSGVPHPRPLLNFDVDRAKPRPYRPFRWEYHQTMALKKLEPDYWLELESTYRERLKQRQQLYVEHGSSILNALPGSERACVELAEMSIQYLCARYPCQFHYSSFSGMFYNHILGTQSSTLEWRGRAAQRTASTGAEVGKGQNIGILALRFLLEHVPEDFIVVQADPISGLYVFRAGVVLSALGWSLAAKIGKPLHLVHERVPYYKEKLQFSMDRFFSKLPIDKPIQRGSWGLEIGQPLFAPPDSHYLSLRDSQSPTLTINDITLRVDWQSLRRLPVSQAIVFNYKALFTPVTAFREEPYIPKLLAKVLREGKESIKEYKGIWHVEHKVLPMLDEWAKEQEERGWVPRDWKERTLDEDPFFPGWDSRYN